MTRRPLIVDCQDCGAEQSAGYTDSACCRNPGDELEAGGKRCFARRFGDRRADAGGRSGPIAHLIAKAEGVDFEIDGPRAVIGRLLDSSDGLDINLVSMGASSDRVSRRHAEIVRRGSTFSFATSAVSTAPTSLGAASSGATSSIN